MPGSQGDQETDRDTIGQTENIRRQGIACKVERIQRLYHSYMKRVTQVTQGGLGNITIGL